MNFSFRYQYILKHDGDEKIEKILIREYCSIYHQIFNGKLQELYGRHCGELLFRSEEWASLAAKAEKQNTKWQCYSLAANRNISMVAVIFIIFLVVVGVTLHPLRVLFIIFSLIFTLATIMRKSRVPARAIKPFLRPTTKILLQFTYKPCRAIN